MNLKKVVVKKFENLTGFRAWLNSAPVAGYWSGRNSASRYGSPEFTGTENYESADELMAAGYRDGAARVAAYMAGGVMGTAPRAQRYYSVAGFAPAVGRYIAGNPLNMIAKKRVQKPAPVVDIAYNCAVGYNIESAEIERAAAKLFNVITGLERGGTRVNLSVVSIITEHSKSAKRGGSIVSVKIKDAGQPFNLLKMIYPVVHPSFLRRHIFAAQERSGLTGDWTNYGKIVTDKTELNEAAHFAGIRGKLLSYYDIHNKSEAEITKLIAG